MKQIKMHWSYLEDVEQICTLLVETYPEGAVFLVSDRERIIFKQGSVKFDSVDLKVGTPNRPGGVTHQVLQTRQVMEIKLDKSLYGVRGRVLAGPIWSENEREILGVWTMLLPKEHKMAGAFDTFAPIMVEMLPGGGAMYITDTDKYVKGITSDNFKSQLIPMGTPLVSNSLTKECMQIKRPGTKDVPREIYGAASQLSAYPLIDDDTGEVVGSFTMAVPRELQISMKEMANTLGRGMSEVSSAMEEMAASAGEVADNQDILHSEIEQVKNNANEISIVLTFIREIAEATKMLGLNAAIEAARAGDAGRGFGVVAEEIRKLSDQSKQTVGQIKELLDKVILSVVNTMGLSDATLVSTQQVAAATEEVNATLEEMNALAEQLDNMAAQL